MDSYKKIFLIGMPGSGKSTIGRILAGKLELAFYDLDAEIEVKHKKTINEIFSRFGEDIFRQLEYKALQSIIARNTSFVLATGGGTPCYNDNMKQINALGKTFFLEASIETLLKRVSNTDDRPLLTSNYRKSLERLLVARQMYYYQANYILKTENLNLETSANKMVQIILQDDNA